MIVDTNFYLFFPDPASQYTIMCGEHELNSQSSKFFLNFENEKPRETEVKLSVTKVITHPKWVTASQGYDIAIYQVSIQLFSYSVIYLFNPYTSNDEALS